MADEVHHAVVAAVEELGHGLEHAGGAAAQRRGGERLHHDDLAGDAAAAQVAREEVAHVGEIGEVAEVGEAEEAGNEEDVLSRGHRHATLNCQGAVHSAVAHGAPRPALGVR